jgi:hypothetical protein
VSTAVLDDLATDSRLIEDANVVAAARVYFLHHSVGADVLTGVTALNAEIGGPAVRLTDLKVERIPTGSCLVHERGGRNQDPASKIAAFEHTLRTRLDLRPDVALMKFCFVDFHPESDEQALLQQYLASIERLRHILPATVFLHVTVPLFARPTSVKSRLKRWIGQHVWEDEANAKRNGFNQRLLDAVGTDPAFDLARVESTALDGRRVTFQRQDRPFFCLAPELTSDGGHLNEIGRRQAARDFLHCLAGAVRRCRR